MVEKRDETMVEKNDTMVEKQTIQWFKTNKRYNG